MFNDDGQCDVDKLAIADGVCAGSLRCGRNVSKNDLDERLKEENAKLRELARRAHGCKTDDGCCEDCWGDYGECPIEAEMRELGIEVTT
jgi:hypothetical protein